MEFVALLSRLKDTVRKGGIETRVKIVYCSKRLSVEEFEFSVVFLLFTRTQTVAC